MAQLRPWIPHIEVFVGSSFSPSVEQQNASLDAVAALVKSGVLTIEALVRELELYLITTDGLIRGRGVTLLGEVLARLSMKQLDPVTIHSLTEFFTSKLETDWQAVHGALVGCLALLKRKHPVSMVAGADARGLTKCFLENIQVQALALDDRKMCFELLQYLLDRYPSDIASLGEQFIHGICEAIDLEKDPSCLMLTFHIVESLGKLFPDPSGPVADFAEELFDILGRYFPIYFVHPKSEDFVVKREDLSDSLMRAFCSSSFFEPFAIPLLLEKLSSDLPLAKMDALKCLSSCMLHYPADKMIKYGKDIWTLLKDAIISNSPCELVLGPESVSVRDKKSHDSDLYIEAVACFKNALTSLKGSYSFIKCVLTDEDLCLCLSSVATESCFSNLSRENRQKLHGIGTILSTSIKASNDCCNDVFQRFFPLLMNSLGILSIEAHSSNTIMKKMTDQRLTFGSLYLSIEMLYSCRELFQTLTEVPHETESIDRTTFLLQSFCTPLAHALVTFITQNGLRTAEETGSWEENYCGVRGMEVLATFPVCYSHISGTVYNDILTAFMSIIIGRFNDSVIWRHGLNALIKTGLHIEEHDDCDRRSSYISCVVEKLISLVHCDEFELPLMLKLEASSAVGTAGPGFMSGIILQLEYLIFAKFSEVFVKGCLNVPTFVALSNYYSSKVLSRCREVEVLEDAPMRFVMKVWDLLENNQIPETYSVEQQATNALMIATKLAFAYCDEEKQHMLLDKAHHVIAPSILSLLDNFEPSGCLDDPTCVSYKETFMKALFASMLIAVRPEVVLPDVKILLRWLKIFTLKGHNLEAQALGSIINKLPAEVKSESINCTLADAIDIVFDVGFSTAYENLNLQLSIAMHSNMSYSHNSANNLIVGLAWIGKGLLLRGHEKVKDITVLLLNFISSSASTSGATANASQTNGNGQVSKSFLAQTAADAFQILLGDSEVCLNKNFHAILRPLYKQKFFSAVTPMLLRSIKVSSSSETRINLYRALGHVISETPLAAFLNEARKLILPLLETMSNLRVDTANKDLVYNLLLVFSGVLMNENGKEVIVEDVHIVLTHIICLASYPYMTLVRETAIQCLVALSELPHSRIYPMRKQVLKAIRRALDDPKWVVRREAAKCLRIWESMTQG